MGILATPSKLILYIGNTQVLQITGLQDYLSGAYLNSATVVGTLMDTNGNEIDECIEVPFTYVPASNGNYQAVFGDENFTPELGNGYTLLIDGNENNSYIHLELIVEIRVRQQ